MPARSIGAVTISFGLVSIPVKLFSATESSAAITFNWLHKKCGSRLKQQYVCPQDGDVVARDDMVKGYEFAKDRYVTFTPEELKALEEEATQAIEITEFIPIASIDPIYFEKPYFLGPDKGGDKAYQLLGKAMRETQRAALARYAARGKQYLVLIRPLADGLVMQQLHYKDEVRSIDEVPIATVDVKENELKLAVQLVEQIANDEFHPEAYDDAVRTRMREKIAKKVEGEEISAAPQAAPTEGARVIDLMEALKASLASKKGGSAAKAVAAEADERKPAKRVPKAPKEKRAKTAGG